MVMKHGVRLPWQQPVFFRQGGITQVVTSIQPQHTSESPKKSRRSEIKQNQISSSSLSLVWQLWACSIGRWREPRCSRPMFLWKAQGMDGVDLHWSNTEC